MPFYPFLRGGDGGQRGHLEDEARGVEETASDSSSDRKAADTKGGSGDRGFKREASPKGGEANPSGRGWGDFAPEARAAFESTDSGKDQTESVATLSKQVW